MFRNDREEVELALLVADQLLDDARGNEVELEDEMDGIIRVPLRKATGVELFGHEDTLIELIDLLRSPSSTCA